MAKNLGETFKELRRGKNFTLKEACQNDLSVAQLSRFEHGQSELTLPVFLRALANINVSIEEYFFIHQKDTEPTLTNLLKKMSVAINAENTAEIAKLRHELTQSSRR